MHASAESLSQAGTAAAAAAATPTGVADATLPNHEPVHADSSSAAGQALSKDSPVGAEEEAVKHTQQEQEGALQADPAMQERSQSHSLELPLSILLTGGGPAKKRGRPYKNAANAEKAAQRDARKATQEAAERAAYQAASDAAQVVIAAPPIKKRRGRPPKDPAKLAAALAAYQANAHARQASIDHEQDNAGFDTVMEAAQAAAARASATALEPAHLLPSEAEVTLPVPVPRSGQRKRGRPPKRIATAAGDNPRSPLASAAHVDGQSAMRQDTTIGNAADTAEDADDDQALLDAAAVLTSDLPFSQGIRRQTLPFQQPKNRQSKGRRRLGNHAKHAVQSKPAAAQGKQHRTGLELVSSRATALLDSIGPDPNGPAHHQVPTPQPHPNLSPQKQGGFLVGSVSEPPAPPVAGRPSKRQRKHHHSSQQPATAAADSAGNPPQGVSTHAPSPPPAKLQTVPETIAHRYDLSTVAAPTAAAASSQSGHDARGSPTRHAAPMSPLHHAAGCLPTPHAESMPPIPHAAAGETTLHSIQTGIAIKRQLPLSDFDWFQDVIVIVIVIVMQALRQNIHIQQKQHMTVVFVGVLWEMLVLPHICMVTGSAGPVNVSKLHMIVIALPVFGLLFRQNLLTSRLSPTIMIVVVNVH